MRPKGKLLTLIALFAAVGVITATGAFTTVEAQRTATVDVTGDASALLGLSAANDISNTDIVSNATDGQISLDFSSDTLENGAEGLNPNANTTFNPLIEVANNGADDVTITIGIETSGSVDGFYFVDEDDNIIGDQDTIDINSGNTENLGVIIETGDTTGDDFDVTITFTAEA